MGCLEKIDSIEIDMCYSHIYTVLEGSPELFVDDTRVSRTSSLNFSDLDRT